MRYSLMKISLSLYIDEYLERAVTFTPVIYRELSNTRAIRERCLNNKKEN